MLLVVDFSDLNLEYNQTDIRLDSSTDFTVGKLITKLCDGIEEFGQITIPNKSYKQVSLSVLKTINHNNNWQFYPQLKQGDFF